MGSITLIGASDRALPDFESGATTLLLASPVGKVRAIVFKVKAFDPTKHPRGYKGLFIDTPDKRNAGDAKVGDVIATKSGKVFRVEGHGDKGIKVKSVDPDSGEVLEKGTIVANGIQVGVVEAGTGPGTSHEIGKITPGSYVQHPKSGKRFQVSKHGKWTTVYPVDAQGNVTGKHTVLPPDTVMLITTAAQGPPPTPQQVQTVNKAVAVAQKQNPAVTPSEVMPKVLPRQPRLYGDGVGKDTKLVIVASDAYAGYGGVQQQFQLYRESPDGTKVPLATDKYSKISAARAAARELGGDHEAIEEHRLLSRHDHQWQKGDYLFAGSQIHQVEDIRNYGSYMRLVFENGGGAYIYGKPGDSGFYLTPEEVDKFAKIEELGSRDRAVGFSLDTDQRRALFAEAVALDHNVVRQPRPSKYTEALSPDWKLDNLAGSSQAEALKTLKMLGYGEITPRESGKLKVINAQRKRIDLTITKGKVTAVDERQDESTRGATKAFKAQLEEVLRTGGDVRELDPSQSPFEEERTSHTRQIVYDMALGKQNHVEQVLAGQRGAGQKVKSDAEYERELKGTPDWHEAKDWLASAGDAPYTFQARGSIVEKYWSNEGAYDFPSRTLAFTELQGSGNDKEMAPAIQAVLQRQGLSELSRTGPADLQDTDLRRFAAKLDLVARDKETYGLPQDTIDYIKKSFGEQQASAQGMLDGRSMSLNRRAQALADDANQKLIDYKRKQEGTVKDAVTGGKTTFELPLWDDIEMKPQTVEDVKALVDDIPDGVRAMVPAFASGGLVQDGVIYFGRGNITSARVDFPLDDVMKTRLGPNAKLVENSRNIDPGYQGSGQIHAGVMYEIVDEGEQPVLRDQHVADTIAEYWLGPSQTIRIQKAGGGPQQLDDWKKAVESWRNDTSVQTSSQEQLTNKLYEHFEQVTGKSLASPGGRIVREEWLPHEDVLTSNAMKDGAARAAWIHAQPQVDRQAEQVYDQFRRRMEAANADTSDMLGAQQLLKDYVAGVRTAVPPGTKSAGEAHMISVMDKLSGAEIGRTIMAAQTRDFWNHLQENEAFQNALGRLATVFHDELRRSVDAGKPVVRKIEYVPHDAPGGQLTPTNQRGRLTLEGYTPDEAVAKLKEYGIVHDLEPEVPFESIMRSSRRYGSVTPLLSDYVQGEAPLPKIAAAVTHGITGGSWGAAGGENRLKQVLESGGLMSTAERYRQGIKVQTTTPAGDIRSGVDHVLFGSMGVSQYGNIKIIYKDHAYLRRDILLTNRDFGPQQTRYPSYRKYHNSLRKGANSYASSDAIKPEDDINTNPYVPLSPASRQFHINRILETVNGQPTRLNAGNNEWNIATQVPVEDIDTIVVPDAAQRDGTNALLDEMLRDGRIAERPKVVVAASSYDIQDIASKLPDGQVWSAGEIPLKKKATSGT